MTDEEWDKQRHRAILAAFQTGRPVFADTEGVLRYADGSKEPLAADVGIVHPASPATECAMRAERASQLTYVLSVIAAFMNGVMAVLWNTWQVVPAVVLAICAVIWYRINRRQNEALMQDPVVKELFKD